uniref:Putative ovule protein n=1 Tax=Solanum chacoense TaxID=4108 RepID=A0A0V0GRZ7_SOLCH
MFQDAPKQKLFELIFDLLIHSKFLQMIALLRVRKNLQLHIKPKYSTLTCPTPPNTSLCMIPKLIFVPSA